MEVLLRMGKSIQMTMLLFSEDVNKNMPVENC